MQPKQTNILGFPLVPPRIIGSSKVSGGILIRCSKCDMNEIVDVQHGSHSAEWVQRRARAKGWMIGKNRLHDLCPTCSTSTKLGEELKTKIVPLMQQAQLPFAEPTQPESKPMSMATNEEAHVDKTQRRSMSLKEKIALNDLLRTILVKDESGDTFSYVDGWSDERVASQFQMLVHTLGNFRRELIGPVRVVGSDAKIDRIAARLASLEAEFASLKKQLGA